MEKINVGLQRKLLQIQRNPNKLIHAQAQTKAQAWKVVHYFWSWCSSVRPYKTKQTDQRVKPLFNLLLCLGVQVKSCNLFSEVSLQEFHAKVINFQPSPPLHGENEFDPNIFQRENATLIKRNGRSHGRNLLSSLWYQHPIVWYELTVIWKK